LELEIDASTAVYLELDARADFFLETAGLDCNGVKAWGKGWKGEVAALVRLTGMSDPRVRFIQRDFRAGNNRAAGICNGSEQSAAYGLPKGGQGAEQGKGTELCRQTGTLHLV
jgi:hypothetical protein